MNTTWLPVTVVVGLLAGGAAPRVQNLEAFGKNAGISSASLGFRRRQYAPLE